MKRLLIPALAMLSAVGLTSCSVAKGLVETVGRTSQSLGRTVGGLGSAVTR